jgi:purine-binding chemotaxis protein CheW
LSFYSDGELYAVDVAYIKKTACNIAVTPIPAAPESVVGIANMKGRVVTILSLSSLLNQKREQAAQKSDIVNAVILTAASNGDQAGLCINKPGELIELDDEKILPPPAEADAKEKSCLRGVIEMYGQLYRIIDGASIINNKGV